MVDRKAALVLLCALGAAGCTTTKDGADALSTQAPSKVVQSDVGPVEAKSFMGAPAGVTPPAEMGGDVGPQLAAAARRAMSDTASPPSLVPLTSAEATTSAPPAGAATTVIRPADPAAAAAAVAPSVPSPVMQQPAPLPVVSGDDDLQRAVASLASGMAQAAAASQLPATVPVAAPVAAAPQPVPSSIASALPPAPFQRSIVMLSGAGAVQMVPAAHSAPPTVEDVAPPVVAVAAETIVETPEPPKPPKRF